MVEFLYQQRALQFDLGDLSSITNSELLKISHVFISHTHIDHFIGFDRLLRTVFGRAKTLTIFGPENTEIDSQIIMDLAKFCKILQNFAKFL